MSRLAIEVKSGVFVASIGARVRDQLWDRISNEWKIPSLMIYSTNSEQGFAIRSHGNPDREVIDFDGVLLLARPQSSDSEESKEEELKNSLEDF